MLPRDVFEDNLWHTLRAHSSGGTGRAMAALVQVTVNFSSWQFCFPGKPTPGWMQLEEGPHPHDSSKGSTGLVSGIELPKIL